jgi:5-formyltetrahydrofolate cyclo-ligase
MKQAIRKEILQLRKNLSRREKLNLDVSINNNLEEIFDLMNPLSVLAFYPIVTHNEVEILPFIEFVLDKKVSLYFPRITNDDLEIVKVNNFKDMTENSFGLFEPKTDLKESSENSFDMILVPGVAFDKSGNRIGFGKSYYDKLLKRIFGFKIGVAYDFQVVNQITTEDHDVPMDLVITDKGYYRRV